MGKLEKEIKSKDKRKNIQKIILGVVFAAGVIGVAAVVPNVLGAIGKLTGNNRRKKNIKYSVNASISRLVEKGLIKIEKVDGKQIVEITKRGEDALDFLDKHNYKVKIPKRWDGRWRVVIFDIKESRKGIREQIRHTLRQVGFVRLQNSVWVYPYDCEDIISLFKNELAINMDLLYMVVEKLENDWRLQKLFKLKK
jgi:DNA-binding transcriptional regulator PaaX